MDLEEACRPLPPLPSAPFFSEQLACLHRWQRASAAVQKTRDLSGWTEEQTDAPELVGYYLFLSRPNQPEITVRCIRV